MLMLIMLTEGRIWSNMLVFWLQKLVCVDKEGQSRVFNISTAGTNSAVIGQCIEY